MWCRIVCLVSLSLIGCDRTSENRETGARPDSPAVETSESRRASDPSEQSNGGPGKDGTSEPERKRVVTITPQAAEKMREIRDRYGRLYLRVAVEDAGPSGFIYNLDYDNRIDPETDYLDEISGLTVLVDRKSSLYLMGTTIDWHVTEAGQQGFKFNNPNAVRK